MSRRPGTLVVRRRALDGPPLAPRHLDRAAVGRGFVPEAFSRSLGTFCVSTDEQVVALTYDDGPHPEHTPRLLDVLAAAKARATFFVLAEPAREHPEIVRRAVAEGHEIALHGADHRSLIGRRTTEVTRSVLEARRVVEDVAGVAVALYRPPYGRHTPAQARALHRAGLELVVWSGDAGDWVHDEPVNIADRAWARVFPGAIVLLHDDRADPETLRQGERLPFFDRAAVLVDLLGRLEDHGMQTSTVSALLTDHPRVRALAHEMGGRG
jgi:peptidoglycan/xylan/chitin deacetylase (PgdA/CDA1 family)